MKSYRRRFALLLLLSLLLHLMVLWWLLDNWDAPKPPPAEIKTVEITLKPGAKPEAPPVEPVPAEPEEEPPESEPEAEKKQPEKPEPEPETEPIPEQKAIPEAAPAPIDNADEFSSNNQEDQSKTKVDFGTAVETEKLDENTLYDQVKSPDPIEKPSTSSEMNEILEKLLQQPVAPEVADKDQESVTEILTTESDQSDLRADQEPQTEKAIIEAERPVDQTLSGTPTPDESDVQAGKIFTTGDSPSFQLEIPEEFFEGIGNMAMLSEEELQEAEVQQPFSEKESKELQLVNEYLERMNRQVMAFWINPYKGNKMLHGVIRLELDSKGYIEDVYVYISSGDTLLDISVEDAIRSVPRFEVPDNEIIANRYYRNLRFHYSSKETKTELMPFEKQQENQ